MSASYELQVTDVGTIKVQKKRGMRSIRLRVTPRGELVVSAPWYVSRGIILAFLLERADWMKQHSASRRLVLKDGILFGKNLQLSIAENASSNRTKIHTSTVQISLKGSFDPTDAEQQKNIEKKMIKAMQAEAEHILLPRLHEVATRIGMEFNQAFIKNLTGRWGSCDSQKNILLSVFLVQLPDELIDYVIIHELAHTAHMNHSQRFWKTVEQYCPNYKSLRVRLKKYDPRIVPRIRS